jgi:beta-glucanase (GH16 family)
MDAGGPPPVATGTFVLDWQDDFDTFDGARWQLMTHSWDTNLAQFSTANTAFANGIVSLKLTPEPSDTVKPYRGVEMRSRSTLTYGKVESRIRFAKGSGVVSSLVLIYTPWPADDWNELDVEYLGRYSDRVQFNAMVYTGPPVQRPVQQSVTPTPYPQIVSLPVDPSADFHVYGVEWTPAEARFTLDGELKHTWSTEIARLKLPQNILLTIWASSAAAWAGPIEPTSAPTTADYDWIRVYKWVPDAP